MVGSPVVRSCSHFAESDNTAKRLAHCLHEGRVIRQGKLTQFDYGFHVNAFKNLTATGQKGVVFQSVVKSKPESCKEGLSS